jgi:hypothetical protein
MFDSMGRYKGGSDSKRRAAVVSSIAAKQSAKRLGGGDTAKLDDIDKRAADLEAKAASLPIRDLQAQRAKLFSEAKALHDKLANSDDWSDPAKKDAVKKNFNRAYDAVLRIDRIGY